MLVILGRQEEFNDSSDLPALRYHITLNQLAMPKWHKKYIYGQKLSIMDQKTSKEIAKAESINRFFYKTEIDFVHSPSISRYSSSICNRISFDPVHKTIYPKYINHIFMTLYDRASDKKSYYLSHIKGVYNGR